MKKILLLLVLTSTSVFGQVISQSGANNAKDKLFQALVVRLYWQEDVMNILYSRGDSAQAEERMREIAAENREIRDAFKNEYHLGPVYFINAQDSKKLIEGDHENLFTDVNGDTVNTKINAFLVADFSTSRNLALEGLNVWDWQDGQWVHPPTPFPSYISLYGFFHLHKRSYGEMVELFNGKFVSR